MNELTGVVGAVFAFALGVLLFGTHCSDDDGRELDADELKQIEAVQLEQALPPVDCRPVRLDNCSLWNDRACFHVPSTPECSVSVPPMLDTGGRRTAD